MGCPRMMSWPFWSGWTEAPAFVQAAAHRSNPKLPYSGLAALIGQGLTQLLNVPPPHWLL